MSKRSNGHELLRKRRLLQRAVAVVVPAALAAGATLAFAVPNTATAASTNVYTTTFAPAAGCSQTYTVPAGVTQVGVDAVGAAGAAGESNRVNDSSNGTVIAGGSGGQGSEVHTTVSVTPGQKLYVGVSSPNMAGAHGGDVGALPAEPEVSGVGGTGGNASFVSASDPQASAPCNPAGSNLLVVAAGGGGGGGSSTYSGHTGGNGGTESGAGAGAGGSNGTHDGGPGGTAGSAGGTGGSGGHGQEYAGYPVFVNECLPGEDGHVGTPNRGGEGGAGAQDPTSASNCQGYRLVNGAGATNGGGGGGGGGYYGGGGGGGADDADTGGGGGGGGAGASYVAGQPASPVATTTDPTVSITPIMTMPQFTVAPTTGSCTVTVYCSFSFAASGFPTPSMTYTSNTLALTGGDLAFKDYGNGTAGISGVPSASELGAHTINVLAQNATSSTTAPVIATFTLTIGYGPISSLTISPTAAQTGPLVVNNGTTQFSVTGRFASGYQTDLSRTATWTSSNTAVATVSDTGVVAPRAAGTLTLTASYAGSSTSQTLTVTHGNAAHLYVTPADSSVGPNPSVGLGSTLQLKATAVYADGSSADVTSQVAWSSTGAVQAQITAGGRATAIGTRDGVQNQFTATLTNSDGSTTSATAQLTVSLAAPLSVTISPSTAGPLAAGATQQFAATGTFPGGRTADVTADLQWTTSNTRVAVFSTSTPGLLQSYLTAGGGTVTVTGTALGSPQAGVTGTASASFVAGTPTSISIGATTRTIGLGATAQLTVAATYSDGSTAQLNSGLTWQSSAPGTVTVSATGLLTGVGTTANAASNVGVSYAGPTGTLAANTIVSLSLDNPISIAISPLNPTVPRGAAQPFTAIGTYPGGATADISRAVLWQSSNLFVGTFNANQLLVSNQAGGQSVSVFAVAANNLVSPATTVTVPVGDPTSVTVTLPSASTLDLGHTEQASATANYQNGTSTDITTNVTWASADPSVLKISATGVVTAVSRTEGASTYVTATFTTGSGATITTGSTSISTTLRYPTSITVTPDSATVVAGGSLAYTATGNYPGGATVDITHSVSWRTATAIPDDRTGMNNNVLVASAAGPTGAPLSVAATWGPASGSAPVTIGPAVSVSGPPPTTTTATAGVPFTATFTASGGSGHYTWSYGGTLADLTLSSTTGSSVTLSGTPSQALDDRGTLTITDTDHPTDSINRIFNITIGYHPQQIVFTPAATALIGSSTTLTATGGGSGNPVTFSQDGATTYGACFVNPTTGTVNFYAAGTCVIDADQNGTNAMYSRAPEVHASIQVGSAQALGFTTTAPSAVAVGAPGYYVAAADIGSDSGNPITLSIDPATTNSACALSAAGVGPGASGATVAFHHAGTCTIDADQPSGGGYLAATRIQQTITVGRASHTLVFSSSAPAAARVGDGSYTPTIIGDGSTGALVLTVDASTTNSACVLIGAAVQLQHAGTCVLDADQAGDADTAPATRVQQRFSIATATQKISFAATPPVISPGGAERDVSASSTSGLPVTLTVDPASRTGACQVHGTLVELGLAGPCVIDADQAGNSDFASATRVTESFAIRAAHVKITSAAIAADASAAATNPVTVQLQDATGAPLVEAGPVTLALSAIGADRTPSPTAVFAATSGGTPISALTLPAGSSSATVYFGDLVAEAVLVHVAEQSGALGSDDVGANLQAGTPIVSIVRGPSPAAVGAAIQPAVTARVVDALGNPLTGLNVSLVLDHAATRTGAVQPADANGFATFGAFAVATPGTYTLTAQVEGHIASAPSASFRIGGVPSVSSVSPSSGVTAGGSVITIHGSGFAGATSVDFGSVHAASYTVVDDATITAVSPAETLGTHDITVTTPNGVSPTVAADAFTALAAPPPPGVTTVSPPAGPAVGGTTVTVTGTGFTRASAVEFGTKPATSFTVVDDTTITAVSPALDPGPYDVTVTTANGVSAASGTDTFTVQAPQAAAPAVTALAPTSGSTVGGTSVTISGTGFTGATSVAFDAVAASSFTVVNATTIIAVSPALSAGAHQVSVGTPNGVSATVAGATFTASTPAPAPPTVTAVGPASGPDTGNTAVTITGTGFTGATAVHFGTALGTDLDVVNDNSINVTAPAQSAGTYDVTVTTPSGTSPAGGSADRFTVTATPAVTSLSPSSGPMFTHTPVTITGHGFTGADLVMFGGAGITDFTVVSDTTITLLAPFEGIGTYPVTVHVPNQGFTPDTAADVFTMVTPPPAPAVTSISPASGPAVGGTSVTITGTDLTAATSVQFGAVAARSFSVVDSTTISAVSPAESAGIADVTVTTPSGTSAATSSDQFTSTAAVASSPVVTAISPCTGSTGGGTAVTITGTGFTGVNAVRFGDTTTTGALMINPAGTAITVASPQLSAGSYDVVVDGPNGASAQVPADTFTAVAPPAPPVGPGAAAPAVTAISPAAGPATGTTAVTITGTNLTGATSVKFGTVTATHVVVVGKTSITAVSPAQTAGVVDVVVTTPGGTSATVTADQFTYVALPRVIHVSPATGPASGRTAVTITGTGFTKATKVRFGSTAASYVVKSSTTIVATSPAQAAGVRDITVTTIGGTSPTGTADRFTYVAAPKITRISARSGSTSGHTSVTITGTGFSKATRVRFGSVAASYVVKSSTTIVATSPAQAAGVRDITVTTIGGTSAIVAADRFTYVRKM